MPTCVIAEAGVNHNGDPGLARALVDAAAACGADAVKFQTFNPDRLASARAPQAAYQQQGERAGAESQRAMLQRLRLSETDFIALAAHCRRRGVAFLSTPFGRADIAFLTGTIGLTTLKLPSGEVTNGPFLLRAARTGCHLILSTGMCSLEDVRAALGVLAYGMTRPEPPPGGAGRAAAAFGAAFRSPEGQAALHRNVCLLHCTSSYPAPFADINLRGIDTLRESFGLPVGLSDHSAGIAIPLAATGRGATIIEKHFTLARTLPGPDHRASLEPDELATMIAGIRQIDRAMGNGRKCLQPSEHETLRVARRSLTASRPIRCGERFSGENLCAKRPGDGRSPMDFWDLAGQPATRDYAADEPVD